ncbi:hypothetical protein A2926_00150 [Candidatus Giovannonibacteria bacterium RIFCSPLOWO2_01_FULL_44_40]|uniref:Aspartyl/glutamyl-tRNA(Asn/Gln) amidotransferase subunit C n=1 Tax=Candidatus Giovannonibacteria bacterium RIFCSPHIGHO2_01_FULL_45_23 TaxID=1798325 RepID=A0A1F5VFK4_9BACT|nr:MAG: hypothetical protein A2834_01105 [Candidatus Giovannonibacteria bacterium RIFCSPHIGHO2_01_FULL_45_23]OGF75139.1 MAG: hypothetical protein A3C77_01315 [Candidatus Giovannonibacteria bacterium RIFCSPHIGHO2_02_FULL_45_13]OGF79703.1 MAG: hypothetical protein A2926_00150 [Candidatus Giovannonibacteria bacterium RIFCSPLOWO2_01_FULL_44_40]
MAIHKEEIEHLKDLARVEFGEKETEKLAKDLGEILGYAEQLKEVDVSNVLEMTHSVDLKNVFRKDEERGGLTHASNLANAFPEKEKNYLKVKSIL